MPESINDKPLADGVNVTPAAGAASASEEVTSIHEVLSKELGKTFNDDASALKAVKDTFSYVGEYGKVKPLLEQLQQKYGSDFITKMEQSLNPIPEAQPQAVDTSKFVTKDELDRVTFYNDHKDLEPHKTLIEALASTTGKTRAEVAELPELKTLITNANAFQEAENKKSVLQSNPRLGVAADNMNKAREALSKGDTVGAENAAMQAVLDAYPELGK